ncbi:MAG: amidohydrolase family protein [Proteobacteria bacterium]|nr:amidohydrolase family protein [Pseudomonadota bacterium]MBS0493384.1 amidohydrolase family protein [Pseudomonadota bacterium]
MPHPHPSTIHDATPQVVDCHAHVFLQDMPLAAARRYAPSGDATPAEYLGLLEAHGVTHGVLVQPSFLGTDNSFLLSTLRAQPQRLRGVVMLEPATSEAELERLAAAGVVGVRLNLMGQPLPDLRTPQWQSFLARLKALDWHLELHRQAADLAPLLDAALHSGCRIVVDHFGRPDALLADADPGFAALLERAASGRIWVKLSAAYRNGRAALAGADAHLLAADTRAAQACAGRLLAAFGPERLVWGSDWPHTQHQHMADYGQSLAALSDWVPDAAQRARILGPTAAELFHIPLILR